MVLFEIHARFKGHFLNELRISFKIINIYSTKIILRDEKLQLNNQSKCCWLIEISSLKILILSRHLLAHNQQRKHQCKMPIMLKVDNKDTRTMPWCLHCQPQTYPTPCSSVSIASPQHAIAGWVFTVKTNIVKLSRYSKQ